MRVTCTDIYINDYSVCLLWVKWEKESKKKKKKIELKPISEENGWQETHYECICRPYLQSGSTEFISGLGITENLLNFQRVCDSIVCMWV